MKINRSRKLLALGALVAVVVVAGAVSIAAASSGSSSTNSSAPGANAGTGTVTMTVTGPSGKTRTGRTRPVRCTVAGGNYVLRLGARRALRRSRVTLTLPSYHGAGSYTGSLALRARVLLTGLQKTISVPVTMTSSGGSVRITRTLPGAVHPQLRGKHVSVAAAWTCTP